jgi:hypothetical protein
LIFQGRAQQLKRERNERMSLAWHVAALTRSRKLPDLERLIETEPGARHEPQSPDQQWAIFSVMAAGQRIH